MVYVFHALVAEQISMNFLKLGFEIGLIHDYKSFMEYIMTRYKPMTFEPIETTMENPERSLQPTPVKTKVT